MQPNSTVQTATNQTNTTINPAEVAESLKGRGIPSWKIDTLAEAIVGRVNDQKLTRTQRDVLLFEQGRPSVQNIISDLFNNKKRTVNQPDQHIPEDKLPVRESRVSEKLQQNQALDQRYHESSKAGLLDQHMWMEETGFVWDNEEVVEKATDEKSRTGNERLANQPNDATMNLKEMHSEAHDARKDFNFISDDRFTALTIEARKKGAIIVRGTPEVERHLDMQGASAAALGDVLLFRKDVCLSEVLEETHHFNQNLIGLNNDKMEPLRTILNEIDAKEYIISVAKKYQIPRNELEHIKKQLESYRRQLRNYMKGG